MPNNPLANDRQHDDTTRGATSELTRGAGFEPTSAAPTQTDPDPAPGDLLADNWPQRPGASDIRKSDLSSGSE